MSTHPSSLTIASLRDGDNTAWADLYDWLAPDLRSFIARIGGADPDELLGETMLQLVRDIASFTDDVASLRPWAFRIARNRVIDAARKMSRRPAVTTLDDEAAPVTVFNEGVVDSDLLRRALEVLNQEQREVLWLRYGLDLSVNETARILQSTEDSVSAMALRALARLRTDPSLR